MADNDFRGVRNHSFSQAPYGNRKSNTHYQVGEEKFARLIEGFAKFTNEDFPLIIPKVLSEFLPLLLKYAKKIKFTDRMVDDISFSSNWVTLMHKGIMNFYHPEYQGKIPIMIDPYHIKLMLRQDFNLDYNPPVEIVMVYGEGGIFNNLIQIFLSRFRDIKLESIRTWEDFQMTCNQFSERSSNLDLFKDDQSGIICKGRLIATQIMKVFLLNIITNTDEANPKLFIPEDIYSLDEMKKYFETNFQPEG